MSNVLLAAIVVGALAIALITSLGYPALLRFRAQGHHSPVDDALTAADVARAAHLPWDPPRVTAIVATREAPAAIVERVRDLRAGDFPDDRLDVVIAVDARSPHATADYRETLGTAARVVEGDQPGGKTAALNAGVRAASGSVLLFADSAQRFTPTTIRDLIIAVGADGVGAVSGVIAPAADDPLLDRYWQYKSLSATASPRCTASSAYLARCTPCGASSGERMPLPQV